MTDRNFLRNERGYALAVVVVFTTVLLISTSEAMINWQKAMQREREEELIFRGKQFIRAIELWQRKFPGTFPTTIDALLNTNNVRFLRKKWKDPITNSDEWRLIKVNPDGSISGLTIIPSGGLPEATIPGAPGQGRSPTSSSAPSGRSGFSQSGSSFGSQSSTQNIGSPQAGQGQRSRSQSALTPVLGGIVGVASTSEKQTLKTYNGRNKYNEWEFYYVPRQPIQPATSGQQPAGRTPGVGSSAGAGIQSQPSASPLQQQPPAPSR
jgi:hypothetical protein